MTLTDHTPSGDQCFSVSKHGADNNHSNHKANYGRGEGVGGYGGGGEGDYIPIVTLSPPE